MICCNAFRKLTFVETNSRMPYTDAWSFEVAAWRVREAAPGSLGITNHFSREAGLSLGHWPESHGGMLCAALSNDSIARPVLFTVASSPRSAID